eukprot:COSAG06_NODE_2440_length_6872_cov_135.458586_8_plen_63_part_00
MPRHAQDKHKEQFLNSKRWMVGWMDGWMAFACAEDWVEEVGEEEAAAYAEYVQPAITIDLLL